FEAARQPAPANLAAELKRLTDEAALVAFLVKTREQLGPCEALAGHQALLASCRAMVASLDPYSALITEDDRKDQPWGDQPLGVGLELADNVGVGPLRVGKVHPGGPAQKAGIRPGDVIERIDGKAVGGLTSAQAAALVQREGTLMARVGFRSDVSLDGTLDAPPRPVKLRLARPGRAPWEVSLEHQTRRPESVLGVRRGDDNSWD